jgi:hypothetical protein
MFVPVTKGLEGPLYVCTCIQAFGEASACFVPMTKFLERPLYILYLQYTQAFRVQLFVILYFMYIELCIRRSHYRVFGVVRIIFREAIIF